MKQLYLLLKLNLMSVLNIKGMIRSRDKAVRKKLTRKLFVGFVIPILLMFSAGTYLFLIESALFATGQGELIFAMAVVAMAMMSLITNIVAAGSTLFNFKDYDTQFSLPIGAKAIALSRVLIQYFRELALDLVFLIPTAVVYLMFNTVEWYFYPVYIIMSLFMPLIPAVITSVLGTVATVITTRIRGKNIFNAVIGMIFALGIMVLSMSFSANANNFDQMGGELVSAGNSIYGIYPPARWFVDGLINLDALSLILYFGVSIVSLFLFITLVSGFMKRINTALQTVTQAKKYVSKSEKSLPVFGALFKREIKFYLSSAVNIVNTAFGPVLCIAAAVLLAVGSKEGLMSYFHLEGIPGIDPSVFVNMMAIIMITFTAGMTCTTASTISLEGKCFWLIKTLPVKYRQVLNVKILLNILLVVPVVIVCSTVVVVVLEMDFVTALYMYLFPILLNLFVSVFGILMNLLLPKLDWTKDTQVVKQSAAVMIAVFMPMIIVFGALISLIIFMELYKQIIGWICVGLFVAVTTIYPLTIKYGVKRMRSLG